MIVVKKGMLCALGVVLGGIAGVVTYFGVAIVLIWLGNLIFAPWHFFDPETSVWAPVVTPAIFSLGAGILVAHKVSGDHRPYCVAVVLVNLLPIFFALCLGELGLSLLFRRGLYIVPAWVLFMSPPDGGA